MAAAAAVTAGGGHMLRKLISVQLSIEPKRHAELSSVFELAYIIRVSFRCCVACAINLESKLFPEFQLRFRFQFQQTHTQKSLALYGCYLHIVWIWLQSKHDLESHREMSLPSI